MQNFDKKDLLWFPPKGSQAPILWCICKYIGHAWLNGHALDLCYNCSKNDFETHGYIVWCRGNLSFHRLIDIPAQRRDTQW